MPLQLLCTFTLARLCWQRGAHRQVHWRVTQIDSDRDCSSVLRHTAATPQSASNPAVCPQGTVEVYAVEIEDVSRAHDSWKDQAVKLDADHARKDREIDSLVSLACQQSFSHT